MRDIALAKNANGEVKLPIYLPQREQFLLAKYRQLAVDNHVDPNMMDLLLSILISAGKFVQSQILQRPTALDTDSIPKAILKANLLLLTKAVAQNYEQYDQNAEATHLECLNDEVILRELVEKSTGGLAVNLGCADGTHVMAAIAQKFEHVVGYDISPQMIDCATAKYPQYDFCVHDLDDGIPLADNSANLVVANFGSASEVCIDIWAETARVLAPGATAFLSFYNRNALVTHWWTPWSNSHRIIINPHNDTLMVPVVDSNGVAEVFWIYGHSADEREVYGNARANGLEIVRIESSSPLWDDKPREFFNHHEAVNSAMEYEKAHAHIPPFLGQYLRVVVRKKHQ